ncbi:MAG TPA: 2OG-Fe(II) oxygenase [Rhodanobacteraceae bacterium]|nr:2OG-Fe(II) oxygenase [Rhodanobacteraceae bacterium]
MPPALCAAWMTRFEASDAGTPGRVGSGLFPELKDSTDITLAGRADWQDVEQALNQAVFRGLLAYLRARPHTLIAPLMLMVADGAGGQRRLDEGTLRQMDDAQLGAIVNGVFRPGAINLQRYRADAGGYPYWHCELFPQAGGADSLHRHLLWTIYLNEGFAGGETEFLYQQRQITPRTGALLIAPAAFTHTHRGNRPRGGDKYIATSWILFQPANRLFHRNHPELK